MLMHDDRATATPHAHCQSVSNGIDERKEDGLLILAPAGRRAFRRVLFINCYGGSKVWQQIKRGLMPPHHLWGCLELVRLGYEVALAEPLSHLNLLRKPLPHDLGLFQIARKWLGNDGILYCGHTLLFWLPALRALGAIKCPIVSLTYAREKLELARQHSGIIALTPAAAQKAREMAPQVRVAHLAWGCDLNFYPALAYQAGWFLSCGITHRDLSTLSAAAARSPHAIRLICPGISRELTWSRNVTLVDGGSGWNFQKTNVGYDELIHQHYAGAAASLIILQNDPAEKTAVGFTSLLEAMALGRPSIVTRTGAIPGELDVEIAGCGLHVPAQDPAALARAIDRLAADPAAAEAMGAAGRQLAEKHYNIQRYATQLHAFFESL
jgi:glycosyltransferase involved in cell wall biosynthesis